MKYKSILVMTDFSEFSDRAVEFAAELALAQKAELTILHVAHDESHFELYITSADYDYIKNKIDEEVAKKFKEQETRIPVLGKLEYVKKIRRGTPYIEGIDEIESNGYDLMVIGSHGETGLTKFFYGSTAEKILRNSPISVHVTKTIND